MAVIQRAPPRIPASLDFYVRRCTVSYAQGDEWGALTFPTPEEALAWARERDALSKTQPKQTGRLPREKQKEGYL